MRNAAEGVSNNEGQGKWKGSPSLLKLAEKLGNVEQWVSEIPLEDMHQQRFGNKSFRLLHKRICDQAERDMAEVLQAGGGDPSKAAEVAQYWTDSFGNATRIDYGTGHELNFVIVMFSLAVLNCADHPDDRLAMLTTVFLKYLRVMRLLEDHYSMEPAGSKGVWGLDDYHHLPFYWGAAQLIGNKLSLTPSTVEQDCKSNADDYIYMECIDWILTNKSGAFHENSPTLASLTSLQWPKIKTGMLKMYNAEVLGKWPVVQHLCFGSILEWPEGVPDEARTPLPASFPARET
ncbi:Serine/threonine-protein phosphatase 2A activator 2 [Diplonema papillatum]|nr:Serine/threonine-protein phosphatase 2A activator 2 [Diplonema papillatum]